MSFGLESQLSLIVIVAVTSWTLCGCGPYRQERHACEDGNLTFSALIETLANRLLPSDLENPSQSFTVIVGELCTGETFRL